VKSKSACPDLELIAAYLDGRMTERERSSIADHLGACEDCYLLFTESSRHYVQHPVHEVRMLTWRKAAAAAAGLAAAAALVLVIRSGAIQPALPPSGGDVAELVGAVGAHRVTEPRLTGGFAYAPMRAPIRTGAPPVDFRSPDVRIAAAKLEKQAMQYRSPDALGSLGIGYLVMGELDKAVSVLEEAADQSKPAPRVLSDLAAAYLTRATAQKGVEDVAKGLALAERALKADPGMAEAMFNRALALERLSLPDQARDAWQQYLKADSSSGWAEEARRHLNALPPSPQSHAIEDERRLMDDAAQPGSGSGAHDREASAARDARVGASRAARARASESRPSSTSAGQVTRI
jgi:hypothetical protein